MIGQILQLATILGEFIPKISALFFMNEYDYPQTMSECGSNARIIFIAHCSYSNHSLDVQIWSHLGSLNPLPPLSLAKDGRRHLLRLSRQRRDSNLGAILPRLRCRIGRLVFRATLLQMYEATTSCVRSIENLKLCMLYLPVRITCTAACCISYVLHF